jgi:hypothetical protein
MLDQLSGTDSETRGIPGSGARKIVIQRRKVKGFEDEDNDDDDADLA